MAVDIRAAVEQAAADVAPSICGLTEVLGLDTVPLATLLSLANATGWSAEKIANCLRDILKIELAPSKIWDIHRSWSELQWISGLNLDEIMEMDSGMLKILHKLNVTVSSRKPLRLTPKPVSVKHAELWYFSGPNPALFVNYTSAVRRAIRNYLTAHEDDNEVGRITQLERVVMEQLGPDAALVICKALEVWFEFVVLHINELPFAKKLIDSKELVASLRMFTARFRQFWEERFGMMDCADRILQVCSDGRRAMPISSTGAATKIFVSLMLKDRLKVLEIRRQAWRQECGFVQYSLDAIPPDRQECPICQERYGNVDDTGVVDVPIFVVACCGNLFGLRCLRTWYMQPHGAACPICRWRPTDHFIDMLYAVEEDNEGVVGNPEHDSEGESDPELDAVQRQAEEEIFTRMRADLLLDE
ncbi:MAG: hypothetical protein M1818_003445 [Claussenomyces sp. TS43310]|nr:MAG: hypothetical protein M1818_003445 [Claussenomyces sp. TS43310]